MLIKLDSKGVQQYVSLFGGNNYNEYCNDMDLNKDGRIVYLVCAISSSCCAFSTGSPSAYVIKFKGTDGTVIKSIRFNGNQNNYANAIKIDWAGNVIMTIHTITWYFSLGYYDGVYWYYVAGVMRSDSELEDFTCWGTVTLTISSQSTDWR